MPVSRLARCRARSPTAGWTTSARTSTTSTARPRSPGRRSPRRATCARRPGTVGRPPRGSVVKIYDEDGKPVDAGRERAHLRRQRRPVRGLHRRRQQGRDRRPAVLRRRRPLRRRRAPVHRRPRRRHDRLAAARTCSRPRSRTCCTGHENVADVAVFGVEDEKFGQRLKAVIVKKGVAEREGRQGLRQAEPRGLQGAARRRVRRRAPAHVDGQGAQARAARTPDPS